MGVMGQDMVTHHMLRESPLQIRNSNDYVMGSGITMKQYEKSGASS